MSSFIKQEPGINKVSDSPPVTPPPRPMRSKHEEDMHIKYEEGIFTYVKSEDSIDIDSIIKEEHNGEEKEELRDQSMEYAQAEDFEARHMLRDLLASNAGASDIKNEDGSSSPPPSSPSSFSSSSASSSSDTYTLSPSPSPPRTNGLKEQHRAQMERAMQEKARRIAVLALGLVRVAEGDREEARRAAVLALGLECNVPVRQRRRRARRAVTAREHRHGYFTRYAKREFGVWG
jgi:hypothetical protein